MGMSFIVGPNMEGLPLSEAVRAGDFLFVSGMCGFDDNGSIVKGGVGAETDRIMKDLIDVLARADTDLSRIAKVNVYLTSADDFDAFNAVYASSFFGQQTSPDRRRGRHDDQRQDRDGFHRISWRLRCRNGSVGLMWRVVAFELRQAIIDVVVAALVFDKDVAGQAQA